MVLHKGRVLGRAMGQGKAGRRLAGLQQAGAEREVLVVEIQLRGEGQEGFQVTLRELQRRRGARTALEPVEPAARRRLRRQDQVGPFGQELVDHINGFLLGRDRRDGTGHRLKRRQVQRQRPRKGVAGTVAVIAADRGVPNAAGRRLVDQIAARQKPDRPRLPRAARGNYGKVEARFGRREAIRAIRIRQLNKGHSAGCRRRHRERGAGRSRRAQRRGQRLDAVGIAPHNKRGHINSNRTAAAHRNGTARQRHRGPASRRRQGAATAVAGPGHRRNRQTRGQRIAERHGTGRQGRGIGQRVGQRRRLVLLDRAGRKAQGRGDRQFGHHDRPATTRERRCCTWQAGRQNRCRVGQGAGANCADHNRDLAGGTCIQNPARIGDGLRSSRRRQCTATAIAGERGRHQLKARGQCVGKGQVRGPDAIG
mmetsp:Transcript_28764/g.54542  ORF Transcript_28764/g.54542 Transcript_28764/m.54542 type:complete len:424 (-) Transcript_28764:659-1930(-)